MWNRRNTKENERERRPQRNTYEYYGRRHKSGRNSCPTLAKLKEMWQEDHFAKLCRQRKRYQAQAIHEKIRAIPTTSTVLL